MGYHAFAKHYDSLTLNIDYKKRAKYFSQVFSKYNSKPETVLDLACGTGNLTFALAELGYNMIGSDASQEMLEIASSKKTEKTSDILFLHQSMQQLELLEPVDGIICALDSINHLANETDLTEVLNRVSKSLVKDGLFIFDVNTEYKHKNILANNCFVYELEDLFCVWQNTYFGQNHVVEIQLDFFEPLPSGNYSREEECFCERIFATELLKDKLSEQGLGLEAVYAEDSFELPSDTEQRLIYVARKII